MGRSMVLGVMGFLLLAVGVALVIKHYDQLIELIVVVAGPLLGIIGLVMMFLATIKAEHHGH